MSAPVDALPFPAAAGMFFVKKSADSLTDRKGEAMLRILLVTARQEIVRPFAEGLASNPEVRLEQVGSGVEALSAVRTDAPHLAIVDSELPDTEPLSLVRNLLLVNAMVNTAVVSPLSEHDFHEASEGLGIIARLPLIPGKSDAAKLLNKLKKILGLIT
jgi:CheY-like chemotaxis protein